MGDLLDLFPGGFSPEPELTPDPPERQLAEAMIDGLGLAPENIVLDGNLHRFGKDRVCWYVAHADNIPAGTFGSWRTGLQETWVANIGRSLTEEERSLSMAAIERAQQRRKEAEAEKHRQSASRAQQLVDTCEPAPPDHPYLTAKGIAPGPALVMSDGRLLLPMYDVEGGICSVQMISQTGQKQFLTGGKVSGALGHIGTMKGASRCYLAEGFATASTIHEATGSPVFFAYSAHNLPPVAKYVASLGVPLTIVADNDESGTGQRYARKASELTGCHVITPSSGDVNDFALAGGDVKALLGHSTEDWLIPFSELVQQPRPVRWLIKKWLPQGGLAMVYGPSGLGKTFLVLDMALSIATGREWGGRIVKTAPVAYLAGEGYAGLATRLKGQAITHQISDAPFWVSRGGCQLDTPDGYNFARTELSKLPERPGLIIVDTLHRFLSGDENSSQDAGKMVRACDKLGQEFGATVLLVHHTGHGGSHARGSTAWPSALDTNFRLSKLDDDGELIVVSNPKQKDAEEQPDTFGRLNSVDLPWVDEDGDTVSTAVWEQCEAPRDDPAEGLRNEISLFERAWWASGTEEHGGAPYVSRSALAAFLEKDCAKGSRALKREMEGASGLVCKLGRGEIIAAESYGYVASEAGLATRLLLAKRENMEADGNGGLR